MLLINVRPGVEARMGLDAARLQEINPRLIHCSITGYGADGPYADRPAYDNVGQALSGWLSMFHQGTDARVPGPAVSDAITGMFAAMEDEYAWVGKRNDIVWFVDRDLDDSVRRARDLFRADR